MKKVFSILGFIVGFLFSQLSFSQCNEFFPLAKGKTWTYENFNSNDKLEGKQSQTVTSLEETSNSFKATMQVEAYDKKGKKTTSGELEMTCLDGVVSFDMRKFVPEEQMEAMGAYEMEVISEHLEYPSNLSPGQKLKDGKITVTAQGSPIAIKIEVNIVDRVVEKKETITTPAGTFETWKIKGKTVMENQMGMKMTFEYDQVEWISKNVGMVRNEMYDKGKMKGYSILTSHK